MRYGRPVGRLCPANPYPTHPSRNARLAGVALVAGVLFLSAAVDAQRSRRQRQASFEDSATVTVVEVPVQVIRSGEPLKNLTREDFELFDGRRRVDITGFDLVDLSVIEGRATDEPVPIAARRHFLLLFDRFFTGPNSVQRAKTAAAELVMQGLHPTDLAAVATFDTRPRLVLGFTSDRGQIRQAIRSLGGIETANAVRDPLGLVVADMEPPPIGEAETEAVGAGDGLDRNELLSRTARETAQIEAAGRRGAAASEVAALTQGMGQLAAWMGNIEGHKHVVFLSEGFDSSVLVGNRGMTQEEQDRLHEQALAVQDGRTWEVDLEETFGSSSAQSEMARMLKTFREANCTIQTVDVSGQIQTQAESNRDSLIMMASDSGGGMFANFTNLGAAMSEMLERNSVTYLLAFQPTNLKQDGKFRRLRVEVKGAPRGTRVLHRPGYFPPKPYAQTSGFERVLGSAQEVMGGVQSGQVDASVLTAGFPAPSGKAYAPVLVEVGGGDLLEGFAGDVLPLELYAYALDEHGNVRDFFVSRMGLDMVGTGGALRQSGFKYWGHFDLDPGAYSVRVLVRNDATGRRALVTSLLEVPGEEPAVQPLLFPEAPGKWVLAREDASEQRADVAYPFLRDGQPFIPAARPEVTPGAEAPISLVASNLGAGSVSVRTQIFRPDGSEVTDGGEVFLDSGSPSGARSQFSGTFAAGRGLEAGDYTLSVTVTDQGNRQHTSSTPIRVPG